MTATPYNCPYCDRLTEWRGGASTQVSGAEVTMDAYLCVHCKRVFFISSASVDEKPVAQETK